MSVRTSWLAIAVRWDPLTEPMHITVPAMKSYDMAIVSTMAVWMKPQIAKSRGSFRLVSFQEMASSGGILQKKIFTSWEPQKLRQKVKVKWTMALTACSVQMLPESPVTDTKIWPWCREEGFQWPHCSHRPWLSIGNTWHPPALQTQTSGGHSLLRKWWRGAAAPWGQ